jgi:hypothetical protein
MKKRKNPIAVGLAKLRWKGTTAAERSEQMKAAAATRYAGMPAEERSQAMRDLVGKRWAKRKAG